MTPQRDPSSVYRVVTLVATHDTSWEEAAAAGIAELLKTISDLRVAQVVELDTVVRDGSIAAYRVKLRVSFRMDARRVIAGQVQTVHRLLIVANETADTGALATTIAARTATGPVELHVLVPAGVSGLASTAMVGEPLSGFAGLDSSEIVAIHEQARIEATERLAQTLAGVRSKGATATGEVVIGDPLDAIDAVLHRAVFDEIIVSTRPAAFSRWVRMDLPSRLRRRFNLLVTHIEQT